MFRKGQSANTSTQATAGPRSSQGVNHRWVLIVFLPARMPVFARMAYLSTRLALAYSTILSSWALESASPLTARAICWVM